MAGTADVFQQIVDFPAEKHLRVLGLPGSGKTRALIERYHALVANGLAGRVFIVTYSHDQLQRLTSALLADGGVLAGPSPVLTYFTLANEILGAVGASHRIIEGMEESLLVRRVVRAYAQDMKSDFHAIRGSDRFQRELAGTFHLLLQNDVRAKRLSNLQSVAAGSRLHDVLHLYERYVEEIEACGAMTYFDVSWHAASACADLPDAHVLRQASMLLVDDFQDVDAGQYQLLGSLVAASGGAGVNVFGDPMGAFYAFRGTRSVYLTDTFVADYEADTIHLPSECAGATLPPALRTLSDAVIGDETVNYMIAPAAPAGANRDLGPLFAGSSSALPPVSGVVQAECVDDEVQEVYGVARRVRDLIDSGQRLPSDIAIVTNEKKRYEPLLRAAFAQHGVVLDTGRPVQTGFRGFVGALLKLIETPGDIVATQTVTTAPYYPSFRATAMGLDNASFRDPAMETTAVHEFAEAARRRLAAVEPVAWMRTFVDSYLLPACKPYGESSGDESVFGFASLLGRRWDEYVRAAAATGERVDPPAFVRVSGLFALQSTVPMPGASEVGFFSSREIRGRFFPAVFVLGCSELLFPSPLKRDALLPASALQTAVNAAFAGSSFAIHGARTADEHLREEHHLLFSSLTRGDQQLFISSPRSFGGQARPAPCSIISDAILQAAQDEMPAAEKTPALIRFARAWTTVPPGSALADRVGGLSAIGHAWNAPPLPPTAFTIERFPISKSSLESYVKCPRQFFYQKVLRIRDDDSGALYVGKVYHDVMAKLNETFPSRRQMLDGVTDSFVDEAVDEAIRAESLPIDTFFGHTLQFHVGAMVRRTIDHDRRVEDDYAVEATETEFEFACGGFAFNGRTDRIERAMDSAVTLMDYKTGDFKKKGATLRKRVLDDIERPEQGNWQVPIYLWGYQAEHGSMPGGFKHIVQQPGKEPFVVMLYVRDNESDLPAAALSNKNPDQGFSYVLTSEIESIMDLAAGHVQAIFAARDTFARTDSLEPCRRCRFNRVCDRRVD